MHLLKKTYLFLIAFMIGYPILYFVQFWRVQNQSSEMESMRVAAVAQMLKYSDSQNTEDLFLNMFDVYLKNGSISYYVIRYEDGRMLYPSSEHALAQESQYRQNSKFEYRSEIAVEDKRYYVFFGKDQFPLMVQLTQLLQDQKEVLFVFLFGIFLLINKVAAYFLNFDIGNMIQWFKSRSSKEEPEILSSEGQRLKNYIVTVEQQRTHAEQLIQEYKHNAYSGLNWAHEKMKAGITSVPMVVGRCDINNYTVLKQKASPELVNYVVQSFFNRGGEYLERYGAYKENASGDEISFFLPEDEFKNAHLTGLHLIRGFFEIFEELNAEATILGIKTSAKAALNGGSVELEKLGGTAETEGHPFILTQRILTTVSEKEANTLQVLSDSKDRYLSHASIHGESSEKVKNYEAPLKITQFRQIKSYSAADLNPDNLLYFRTDHDIANMLHDMAHFVQNREIEKYEVLRAHLASLKIARATKSIAEKYQFLIETSLRSQDEKVLSGVAFLAKILLSVDSITEGILLNLELCLHSSSNRVISNARESLYHLRPDIINLHKFLDSHDNRAAADSLIDLVKTEGLTDAYTEKLLGWLHSSSTRSFQLSALYAIFKICEHWNQTRPDYVGLNPNFKKIDTLLQTFGEKHGSDPKFGKWLRRYHGLQLPLSKKTA